MTGRWELNQEALDALLHALDPDREKASREYEALRSRLIDLFTWERCAGAEQLADETMNRLARRVASGEPVASPRNYAHGIARMMMLEAARESRKAAAALNELRLVQAEARKEDDGMGALEECLNLLPDDQRKLIEAYYSGSRDRLAKSLGITVNTLRNRALRIREKLFDCVTNKRDKS